MKLRPQPSRPLLCGLLIASSIALTACSHNKDENMPASGTAPAATSTAAMKSPPAPMPAPASTAMPAPASTAMPAPASTSTSGKPG